jgi:hypothetical protein
MKTAFVFLATVLAAVSAFTAPSIGRASTSKVAEKTAFSPASPREGRQSEIVVTKNALREFANWNDVWDGYGGGYGGCESYLNAWLCHVGSCAVIVCNSRGVTV